MINESQRRAIEILDKPLIVIAGPGTGKTTLITEKINFLLLKKGFSEDEILAITFTNKASEEMSERVEVLSSRPFVSKTFHQFCLELIEDYAKFVPDVDKGFRLIDNTAQLLFFLENIDDIKFSSIEIKNNYHLVAYELASVISKLKDFGVSLKDFERFEAQDNSAKIDVLVAYSKYELYKRKNNFVDFGDLQLYAYNLLKNNEKVREEVRKKYKYILVDEFQDTNKIQLDIVKLISGKDNITVVGDLKQSIYEFRGANFGNLDDFRKFYSDYEEIYLSENYRCSKKVLSLVNDLTRKIGTEKELLDCKSCEKGVYEFIEAKTEKAQFSFIADKIMRIVDKNPDASIGVLFRRKAELRSTALFLKKLGVKFNSFEAMNFFELPIVKSVLMQLGIVANPKESNSQVFELLLDYGVRPVVARKISRRASLREKSIYDVLDDGDFSDDEAEARVISDLKDKISGFLKVKNSKTSLATIIREVVFGFNNYQKALYNSSREDVLAINRFLEFVDDYLKIYRNHDLGRFLKVCDNTKDLDIDYGSDEELGGVSLFTVHASKGKEFDYVIMPYLNERRFPISFKRDKFEIFKNDKKAFLEEEKRLFFVGISRAKKEVYLSYVKKFSDNKFDSRPSEFVFYLDWDRVFYDKEIEEFKVPVNDDVKIEVASKIRDYILDDRYDLAKKEIGLLESLFSKKDLSRFVKDVHPSYDFYREKLNGSKKEFDISINKNRMIYSVSQLKTYESCPKKYLYGYVFKVPSEDKHYFDFGTSLHGVVEDLVLDMDKYSDEVLFARGVSMLKDKWISKGYDSSHQEREYFEKGIRALKDFIGTQRRLDKEERKTIMCEEKFLIDVEGRKITGFIDRIDEVGGCDIEILDYKTSGTMENENQLKENLQLYVYSLAVEEMLKKKPKSVGLWYLVFDKIAKLDLSELKVDELRKKTIELIEGIESENFDAKPSFFACKFCDYNKICKDSKI